MKKIIKTPYLQKAQQLVVRLTVLFAEEIQKRNQKLKEVAQEKQFRYSGGISIAGESLAILFKLSIELEVLEARRREGNTDKYTKILLLLFLKRFKWYEDSPFGNIETEFDKIFGVGSYKDLRGLEKRNWQADEVLLATLKLRPSALESLARNGIATVGQFRSQPLRRLKIMRHCGVTTLQEARTQMEALGANFDHWFE